MEPEFSGTALSIQSVCGFIRVLSVLRSIVFLILMDVGLGYSSARNTVPSARDLTTNPKF